MTQRDGAVVVVHDYSGHPGQAQLSRALAARGFGVVHQHCAGYVTGRGSLEHTSGDPAGLIFETCGEGDPTNRYAVTSRVRHEISYGRSAARAILAHHPSVVVLSNVPLLAHALLARRLRRRGVPMIFWHQDIYSAAIGTRARQKLPRLGRLVAWVADRVERHVARGSAAIVAISPTFLDKLTEWGVAGKTTVVGNWGPIDEIPSAERHNQWSKKMGLDAVPVVLYSGTLGLKHDPSILGAIADRLATSVPEAKVVVVSAGLGRQWLENWRTEHDRHNLVLLDYQPYTDLPDVLGTADVLVAILEPDASKYSVPSKVLTYLCAGRAIVGVLPRDNSVARILLDNAAGVVVDPLEREEVCRQVEALLGAPELRGNLGRAARDYAEREFSPELAADVFAGLIAAALAADGGSVRSRTARPERT